MTTFKKAKKIITLSSEKKADLWQSIEKDILFSKKDVRIVSDVRLGYWEAQNALNLYSKKKNMFISLITFLSLVLAGGTSFAAESSLPGDVLYPIKIYVNENVESAVTIGAQNEANLQLALIKKRLEEKAQLEAQARLTVEVQAQIEENIRDHRKIFEQERTTLESQSQINISNDLKVKLGNILWVEKWEEWEQTQEERSPQTQEDSNDSTIQVGVSGNAEVWSDKKVENKTQIKVNTEIEGDTQINNQWDTTLWTHSQTGESSDIESEIKANTNTQIKTEDKTRLQNLLNTTIWAGTQTNTKAEIKTSAQSGLVQSGTNDWDTLQVEDGIKIGGELK